MIEMAREAQTTAEGERRSRERMRSLEKALAEFEGKVNVSLPKENKLLTNKRLYLYYLQNGKDIYTGADLDINLLSTYDIDHIIPQSFIKDDSLDNIALTTREDNRGKLDNVPSSEVVRKMKGYWQQLLKAGLMSDRKYNNLTKAERGGLTEDDKKVFIRRQLVETRQITKHVARILDERFNHEKNESGEPIRKVRVITLKSKLVSDFRKKFELYKVREINDFHHAHDAYLNAIVGTLLLKKYPKLESEFVYGAFKKLTTRQTYEKATRRFLFYSNILNFLNGPLEERVTEDGEMIWDNDKDLPIVRNILNIPQVNIVKKIERVEKGPLYKETIHPREVKDDSKLISIKRDLPTKKYGGYKEPLEAYSLLVAFEEMVKGTKKISRKVVKIPIKDIVLVEKDVIGYLNGKGINNTIGIFKIYKNSLFEFENGRRRLLSSATELQKGNTFYLSKEFIPLLYNCSKYVDEGEYKYDKYISEHKTLFEALFERIMSFVDSYIQKPKVSDRLRKVFNTRFSESNNLEIAKSFVNLLTITNLGASSTFVFFGEEITRNNYRYNSSKEHANGILVLQALTGLYETRIDLSKFGE